MKVLNLRKRHSLKLSGNYAVCGMLIVQCSRIEHQNRMHGRRWQQLLTKKENSNVLVR